MLLLASTRSQGGIPPIQVVMTGTFIASGVRLFAPTVTPALIVVGEVTGAFVASSVRLFAPAVEVVTVIADVVGAFIESAAQLFAPTVEEVPVMAGTCRYGMVDYQPDRTLTINTTKQQYRALAETLEADGWRVDRIEHVRGNVYTLTVTCVGMIDVQP